MRAKIELYYQAGFILLMIAGIGQFLSRFILGEASHGEQIIAAFLIICLTIAFVKNGREN